MPSVFRRSFTSTAGTEADKRYCPVTGSRSMSPRHTIGPCILPVAETVHTDSMHVVLMAASGMNAVLHIRQAAPSLGSPACVCVEPMPSQGGCTCHGHGHSPKEAAGVVQVQPVAFKEQVHVGPRKVICGIPEVESHVPTPDPAAEEGQLPGPGIVGVHLELTGKTPWQTNLALNRLHRPNICRSAVTLTGTLSTETSRQD